MSQELVHQIDLEMFYFRDLCTQCTRGIIIFNISIELLFEILSE